MLGKLGGGGAINKCWVNGRGGGGQSINVG